MELNSTKMAMAEHADHVEVGENTVRSSSPEKQLEVIVPRAEGQPENEKITGRLILAFIVSTINFPSKFCYKIRPLTFLCPHRP